MSIRSSDSRFFTRFAWLCFIALLTPFAIGLAISEASDRPGAAGSPGEPLEVVLPFEMQASFQHSLPIAGFLVTPDDVAQLVLLNPRLRVTTGTPVSGRGSAVPIPESAVADTLADPLNSNQRSRPTP